MTRFLIGDFLTGRRIQWVPAVDGSWSEALNDAGAVSCTVTLRDPDVLALGLPNSAVEGKSYLAAVDGDTVLQAGPIWGHTWEDNSSRLTLLASGAWSYLDHRVILPYPTTDPTTADTNLVSSLQGIARAWVAQAQDWPNGDVPIVLPDEIAGTNVRNEAGANLAKVGARLAQLTEVEDGPDIQFRPRFQTDRLGVEWVMRIGTPDQPQLFAPQDVKFNVSVAESSVSNLTLKTTGGGLATRAYAAGGRSGDQVLIRYAENSDLVAAGFPALDAVDSSFSSVSDADTLQAHAAGAAQLGSRRLVGMSFDHDLSSRPYLAAFNIGDFAAVSFKDHPYVGTGTYRMRITGRSGDAIGKKVRVDLQPEDAL